MRNRTIPVSNAATTRQLYEHRQQYRHSALDTIDPQQQINRFLDLWYDRPLYGKSDVNGNMVMPIQESSLKQLPGGKSQFAIDFVADAFIDMRDEFRRSVGRNFMSNKIGGIDNFQVERAWTDAESDYETHLDSHKQVLLSSWMATNDKRIKNFADFFPLLERFIEKNAHITPITLTGFMGSEFCNPRSTGLAIELYRSGHGDDDEKVRIIEDESFRKYVALAGKYGFFVNKNAPWTLISDLASPVTAQYQKAYGMNDPLKYYESYCYPTYLLDLKKLQDFAIDTYYAYITQNPFTHEISVCKNGVIKKKIIDRELLTLKEMRGMIPDMYWLRLYFLCRVHESRITIKGTKSRKILHRAGTIAFRDGHTRRAMKYLNLFFKRNDRRISYEPWFNFVSSLSDEQKAEYVQQVVNAATGITTISNEMNLQGNMEVTNTGGLVDTPLVDTSGGSTGGMGSGGGLSGY